MINFLGIYAPVCMQIILIKVSTFGNWNELLQSDLVREDDDVSVHSRMFKEVQGIRWSSLLVSENLNPTKNASNIDDVKELFKMGSDYASFRKTNSVVS